MDRISALQKPDQVTIGLESPLADDLLLLFQRHTADMHAETPPGSCHMMPSGALAADDIDFFVMRRDGSAVGMGAVKRLDAAHGEIKSMHILAEHRGSGLSRLLLTRLIDHAQSCGLHRLSLETGTQPGFRAARTLYERAGFVECPPFGSYRLDPNSVFMALNLKMEQP